MTAVPTMTVRLLMSKMAAIPGVDSFLGSDDICLDNFAPFRFQDLIGSVISAHYNIFAHVDKPLKTGITDRDTFIFLRIVV